MIERSYGSAGDPVTREINEVISIVAGGSTDEVLEALKRYDIEWYVSGEGALFIRYWQVVAEGFVSPERAAEIRVGQEMPKEIDHLEWLSSNLEELRRLYAGQWIAIEEGRVVAAASTLPELVQATERMGVERPFVTLISDQEITWNMAYG